MLINFVLLTTTLVFLKEAESALLKPVKQCVPTTTVRGPCHLCVCSHEGVFHCRPQKCQDDNEERTTPNSDCISNYVFRQDNIFCRCSDEGFWQSDNCKATFRFIYPITNRPHTSLRTNVQCVANDLYLFDCNICRCSKHGIINVTLCTSRSCGQGHKAESCAYGDFLRLDNQLCLCSDVNYYIDRLCIKILDEVVQPLSSEDILLLDDIGKSWRPLSSLAADSCDTAINYTLDCSKCVCTDGRLVCTKNVCEEPPKRALRQDKENAIESLSELESDVGSECEPGKKYRHKCNVCVCDMDGSPICTTMVCLQNYVLDLKALRDVLSAANVTRDQLPEIRYGEKCTNGKKYRMDCNVCHCGKKNSLLCTKAACIQSVGPPPEAIAYTGPPLEAIAYREPLSSEEKDDRESKKLKHEDENTVAKKKKGRKNVRQRQNEEHVPPKPLKPKYPKLPPKLCKPGKIYQEGCQRCYCKANKKPVCSTENACDEQKVWEELRPIDVRTPIKDKEFNSLPELPHAAAPCEPGSTYRVDCHTCVCDEFKNLICDKLLCISYDDMHSAEAHKKSGLPCNKDNFVENEIIQSKCVMCSCNGVTHCEAKEGCVAEEELAMRMSSKRNSSGLAYDYHVEKCLPNHIYRDNCNKCYCQPDQSLRCTQKTCLNYSQAQILEKQHKYLVEHGL